MGEICATCGIVIDSTKYVKIGGEAYHMHCPDPNIDDTLQFNGGRSKR